MRISTRSAARSDPDWHTVVSEGARVIYDCIVVGAGPAGGSAAYHLARRGYAVLLLEKSTLPRYKPCGGLVDDRVADWFDFDFSPAISTTVQRGQSAVSRDGDRAHEVTYPRPVWMVHRAVFDDFLVQQARGRGAEVLDGTPVVGARADDRGWRVDAAGASYQGRFVIAADGAKGPMARWLGFSARAMEIAGALDLEIPVSSPPEPVLRFRYFDDPFGYAWSFPKADALSIGVGAWRRPARPLREILAEYVASFGLSDAAGTVAGHPLLLWNGDQVLHTHRAVLAGEAACLVDPVSGEGICPAIFSGMEAAGAVARALDGDDDALADYTAVIQAQLGRRMAVARARSHLAYDTLGHDSPEPTLRAAVDRLASGEITYQQYLFAELFVSATAGR
jgi:geranylgeranyl reductase family protein